MHGQLRPLACSALFIQSLGLLPGWAQVWGGDRALLLRRGAEVELQLAGRETPLDLPADVRIDGVADDATGTWVTGTRRDALGRELYLARIEAGVLREIAPPLPRLGRLRAEPQAVRAGDAISGLIWLEGDSPQQFAVRSASLAGDGWKASQEIAHPGPGSQLALATAGLADGSALVVWSRFDGRDDEIFFSHRVAGEWTAPQAVATDNAVPDVTPALAAQATGALAAWSRYDGHEYRVVTAAFDGTRWSAPREVGGPGSLEPALAVLGDTTYLLYQRASPRSWELAELAATGEVKRRARFARGAGPRPVVVTAVPGGRPGLRWPDATQPAIWEP